MTHSKGEKTESEGAHPELFYIPKCESYLWQSAWSPITLFTELSLITFDMEDPQNVLPITT